MYTTPATHTRFQHSLGVMHLAGEYYNHLIGASTDLQFDAVNHLCVQIAGLVHYYVKCKYMYKYLCLFCVYITTNHDDRNIFPGLLISSNRSNQIRSNFQKGAH